MAIQPAPPEAYEEAQRSLRAEVRAPRAEARNVAIATETHADSYFTHDGILYKAPPVGYKLGVQLQEIQLHITNLVKDEEQQKIYAETGNAAMIWSEEQQVDHLTTLLATYERCSGLFWQCCAPVAFWKRRRFKKVNPFINCTAQEVGELLGFFYMCRMRSRVELGISTANRPSLSTLTTPMT